MTTQPDKPRRGPGRPRKNPPSPPAVEKQSEEGALPLPEGKTAMIGFDPASALDWPQLLYEVMVERGSPATAAEVADLTSMSLAEVTEILDALVSQERLILGDDDLYRLDQDRTDDQDRDGEPVAEKPRVASVAIPTSSIYAFLSNLNLPPEYLRGLGSFSGLSGTLYYEALEPIAEDPRPKGTLKVRIEGTHTLVSTPPNPNQPGYVADLVPTTSVSEAPE